MDVLAVLILLAELVALLLQFFALPLDVLDHEVLSANFVVVGLVVDDLVVGEPDACVGVEDRAHRPDGGPVEVPVLALAALPVAFFEVG